MKIISWIKEKFKRIEPIQLIDANYIGDVMILRYSDGSKKEYHGSCTVWYEMPLMLRCSTSTEKYLNSIWKYINYYGNPYPTAHHDPTR